MQQLKKIFHIIKGHNWWLSLFFSIPLAIVANLLTPRVQSLLDSHSRQSAERQLESAVVQLERTAHFVNFPDEFTQYLLMVLIKIAALSAILTIVSMLSIFAPRILRRILNRSGSSKINWGEVFGVVSYLAILMVSLQIVSVSMSALGDYERVKTFAANRTIMEQKMKDLRRRLSFLPYQTRKGIPRGEKGDATGG